MLSGDICLCQRPWDISLHLSVVNHHPCLDGRHVRRVQGLFFPGGESRCRRTANKSRPVQLGRAIKAGNLVNIPSAALPMAAINPRSLCYQLGWKNGERSAIDKSLCSSGNLIGRDCDYTQKRAAT